MNWKIHVLYLGDITIPKAMGTMGLDMNLVFPGPLPWPSSWNPALEKLWWTRGFIPVLSSMGKPGPGRRPRGERSFCWRP